MSPLSQARSLGEWHGSLAGRQQADRLSVTFIVSRTITNIFTSSFSREPTNETVHRTYYVDGHPRSV